VKFRQACERQLNQRVVMLVEAKQDKQEKGLTSNDDRPF